MEIGWPYFGSILWSYVWCIYIIRIYFKLCTVYTVQNNFHFFFTHHLCHSLAFFYYYPWFHHIVLACRIEFFPRSHITVYCFPHLVDLAWMSFENEQCEALYCVAWYRVDIRRESSKRNNYTTKMSKGKSCICQFLDIGHHFKILNR